MYEVVPYEFMSVVFIYIVFAGASIVTYPLLSVITNALSKGVSKWK